MLDTTLAKHDALDVNHNNVTIKSTGKDNVIYADWETLQNFSALIEFIGSGNTLYIGRNFKSVVRLRVIMKGNNGIISIGDNCYSNGSWIQTIGNDCQILIGEGLSSYLNTTILCVENNSKITIGKDCLFASECAIRTSDHHAIFDLDTKERINPARNITIGDRIWLGENAKIMKGVTISNDVVIGGSALVTKDIPSFVAVAGIPAKIVKRNVFWYKHLVLPPDYDPHNC